MISERAVYVGVVLPGQPAPTPAGLLKLARRETIESGSFAYGLRYLDAAGALALNPDHLPLRKEVFDLPEKRLRDGGALPLSLRDALPDTWGRAVLEAQHGPMDDIDVLLQTNADRVGALVFSEQLPMPAGTPDAGIYELAQLAEAARRLEYHMEVPKALQRLLRQGGSLGGARPKATFVHEGRRHLAKFPARDDELDVPVLEAGTLAMAQDCGIRVPAFFVQQIPNGSALVLARFDRIGPIEREQRLHYLSASALLDVPYESSAGSYVELAQALRRISSEPAADLEELFRRMVFNIVVDNCDDHIKNHGVLRIDHGYRLAPAFDLVPQRLHLGNQQLAILPGRFDSHLDLVREAAPHFGLGMEAAQKITHSIVQIVRDTWQGRMEEYGAREEMIRVLKPHMERQLLDISR
ncbi:type II toxin-antitoxin system HipA family toxin [Uliginosibacterium sp. H3]|uniref:Type II toxin-antitoxin system HipA family toxin n=1 Tax=Uliginosibacterium silvisoli TaxID=3114758 RepID=A0ABU6K7V1_9RHOO|nr:type II toxin-antitoxin system HipA family toxin [Uliginosibacterium sp. H3]